MPARTARTDRPSEAPLTKTEWERLKTRLTAVEVDMERSHSDVVRGNVDWGPRIVKLDQGIAWLDHLAQLCYSDGNQSLQRASEAIDAANELLSHAYGTLVREKGE